MDLVYPLKYASHRISVPTSSRNIICWTGGSGHWLQMVTDGYRWLQHVCWAHIFSSGNKLPSDRNQRWQLNITLNRKLLENQLPIVNLWFLTATPKFQWFRASFCTLWLFNVAMAIFSCFDDLLSNPMILHDYFKSPQWLPFTSEKSVIPSCIWNVNPIFNNKNNWYLGL